MTALSASADFFRVDNSHDLGSIKDHVRTGFSPGNLKIYFGALVSLCSGSQAAIAQTQNAQPDMSRNDSDVTDSMDDLGNNQTAQAPISILPDNFYGDSATTIDDSKEIRTYLEDVGGILGPYLTQLGFTNNEVYGQILPQLGRYMDTTRMHSSQHIIIRRNAELDVMQLEFPDIVDPRRRTIYDTRNGEASQERLSYEYQPRVLEGQIQGSVYETIIALGGSEALANHITDLFEYDVDWRRDIRRGDSFRILFDTPYLERDNRLMDNQPRLQYINLPVQGESVELFRYEGADGNVGFYKEDGTSIHSLLDRYPVENPRITSGFNPRRRHPVYRRIRAHNGTDFGGPTGTSIFSAGDGVVIYRGFLGSNGHLIRIDHGQGVITAYAHLSGYADELEVGDRLERGDVIGYLGATGTATGPHLHYAVRLDAVTEEINGEIVITDGRFVNPMTFEIPMKAPLEGYDLVRFENGVERIREELLQQQQPVQANPVIQFDMTGS